MKQIYIVEKRARLLVAGIFAIFLIAFVGIVSDTADAGKKSKSGHSKYSKQESIKQYFKYLRRRGVIQNSNGTPAKPDSVPQDTGVLFALYDEREHPLSVKTDSESDYYVKLQRAGDAENAVVMTMFIKGGETLDAKAPSGNYEIKYAAGNGWHGEEYLFWEDTRFYKTDEIFVFDVQTSPTEDGILYTYGGYEVELIEQVSGNLETSEISAVEF